MGDKFLTFLLICLGLVLLALVAGYIIPGILNAIQHTVQTTAIRNAQ